MLVDERKQDSHKGFLRVESATGCGNAIFSQIDDMVRDPDGLELGHGGKSSAKA
jgi:hypothetical protein